MDQLKFTLGKNFDKKEVKAVILMHGGKIVGENSDTVFYMATESEDMEILDTLFVIGKINDEIIECDLEN